MIAAMIICGETDKGAREPQLQCPPPL